MQRRTSNGKRKSQYQIFRTHIRIGVAESTRDQKSYDWLAEVIAPELAFQKANGEIVDRERFLESVEPLPSQVTDQNTRETKIESIEIYGNRVVVACVVTLKGMRYHNLRLLVRRGEQWKLLGWANELLDR